MNKLGVIFVLLLFYAAAFAQERIATSTRWTDMGQDEAGVQMYVSFNMLGKEIAQSGKFLDIFEQIGNDAGKPIGLSFFCGKAPD